MKFFRKMDEMELHLSLNAIRVTWFFTVMALFIWGIWEYAQTGRFTAPMYLFLFQYLLYFLALQVGRWRTGDQEGVGILLLYVLLLVIFLLAFGLRVGLGTMENRIRELRKAAGLRQEDLARELGVTRQTINAIENNKYDPTLGLAMRLARLLGTAVEDIFHLPD